MRSSIIRPLDYGVLAFAVTVVSVTAFFVYGQQSRRASFSIHGGTQSWQYPLTAAETLTVHGPLGETIVVIKDKTACITASPCKNQLCVMAGAIRRPGQAAACLPNRVSISISGVSKDGDIDAGVW